MDYSKEQLLNTLAQIAPNRYLQAFLIIVLFFLGAKVMDIFLTRFIRRLLKKTKFTLDDQILDIFHKPIFVSIMVFGLALAAIGAGAAAGACSASAISIGSIFRRPFIS